MLLGLIPLLLSLLCAIGSCSDIYESDSCPPREEIPTCKCLPSRYGLSVSCKPVKKEEDFLFALKSLKGHTLNQLYIRKYDAPSWPTDLFQGLEIADLELNQVQVNDASFRRGQKHFQGLENSLKTLVIGESFQVNGRYLLNLQMDHLTSLTHILLERNSIPEVGNDWFPTGPKSLETLIFEQNGIEEVGDRAFSALENIKLLGMSGNHLNSVSRSMFPIPANSLSKLDLSYNKIRTLPEDMFTSMPALREVNLDYNLIHVVSKQTWGPVSSQLRYLYLLGNPLECDHLKWICETKLEDVFDKCKSSDGLTQLSMADLCKV